MSRITDDRLVFFGTDAFSVPSLARLFADNWNIVAAVTKPDRQTGRGRELSIPAVKRVTLTKGVPVLQPDKLTTIKAELESLHVDAGIVVSYGKIIPPSILKLFPKGLINVHASLLPRYRGASPIEAALLNGDKVTGVTLMQIDAGLDTGPTYASAEFPLKGHETRQQLYEQLSDLGAELLAVNLPAILDGSLPIKPQDSSKASTTGLLTKQQGHIHWLDSAQQIERKVRAYLGWPGTFTKFSHIEIIITAAHAAPTDPAAPGPGKPYKTATGDLAIACGTGTLIIDRLKPAGKRDMTGREFLAGHHL